MIGWLTRDAVKGFLGGCWEFVGDHWKPIVCAAAIVVVAWLSHNHGYDRAAARCAAAAEKAEDQAAADSAAIVEDYAAVDLGALTTLQAIERVRTIHHEKTRDIAHDVYRDRPGCALPEQLWRGSDQYTADLAAAAGVELGAVRPADAAGQRRDPGAEGP